MNGAGHGDREYRGTRRRTEPTPEVEPEAIPEWEQFRPRGRRHKQPTGEQEHVAPPAVAAPPSEPPGGSDPTPRSRRRARNAESVFTPPDRNSAAPAAQTPGPWHDEPETPDAEASTDTDADAGRVNQLAALGFGDTREAKGAADDPDDFEAFEYPTKSKRRSGGKRSQKRTRKEGTGRPKRRRVFPQILALTVLLVFVVGAGGVGVLWVRGYFAPPDFDGDGGGEAEVVIESGQTGEQIGEMLVAEGVVASTRAFTNALRLEGVNDMRPGTYMLRQEMSAEAAVTLLTDPNARIGFRVTIREGLRLSQILEEINESTEIPLEELEQVADDPESHLELPEYAEGRLDGYLFPDTYTFEPDIEAVEVLQKMLDRFEQVSSETDFEQRAEDQGHSPQEMMAIAAIAQAEAGSAADMPKISQVVYNRLDADMELGMDSTCFFVINDYGIALSGEQLQECQQSGSGYATYGRHGLPTGPIVNPGTDAMESALEPEAGEWLYFVTTDPENGVTEFAETEAEFDVLVERFRQTQEAE